MNRSKALALALVITFGFGVAGMALGYAVGTLAPEYYRGVFPRLDWDRLDPTWVSMALGLFQGLAVGFVVAVVVLGFLVLSSSRARRHEGVVAELRELRLTLARLEAKLDRALGDQKTPMDTTQGSPPG